MGGKQLRLFLVDGTPGGLTTAQIMNWTGQVLSGRRSDLADLLRRPEAQRPGVYLLLGDDDTAIGGVRCYIGEAEDGADRLRNHQRNKEFWDRVVVITSTDENLTKGHIRYLEARLIELATRAARVELENGTQPPRAPLPEADRSDMDYFIDQLHVILPVLGINAIRVRELQPLAPTAAADQVSPIFRLLHTKLGVDARAQQVDGEFTMLAGSTIVASVRESSRYSPSTAKAYASYRALHEKLVANGTIVRESSRYSPSTAKAYASYRALHEKLVANGTIVVADGQGLLTRDAVFSSPSTAGAIALGRSCNGRDSWISAEGETFGRWESRGVEDPIPV